MSNEPLDRDAYAIELLRFLAEGGRFDGDQMGPDHTLDQISVAEDLIEMGYMKGQVLNDGRKAMNIGFPGITAQGRKFLKSQTSESPKNPSAASSQEIVSVNPGVVAVSDHARLVGELRSSIATLAKRLTSELATDRLNSHVERIGFVKQNLDQMDLSDLTFAPEQILMQIKRATDELIVLFDEKLIPAGNLESRHVREYDRPGPLQLTEDNLAKWRQQIEIVQVTVFNITAPLLMHQTRRRLERSIGTNVSINVNQELTDDVVVWKYFPFRNFVRCALSSGIWMCSMNKLREWPAKRSGIPDCREGEIPPALESLKRAFDAASEDDAAWEELKVDYPFVMQSRAQVSDVLDTVYELSRVFVSSWSARPSESAGMWMHYANNGRGVAIKTTVGRLKKATWRIPFHLSGLDTSDVVFYGLVLRRVKYLSFTGADEITSIDDCYVPFLKREEFDDERELRMLGLTTSAVPMDGLALHCKFNELIEEIVVGPNADESEVKRLLNEKLPLLQQVPMRRSKLAKLS